MGVQILLFKPTLGRGYELWGVIRFHEGISLSFINILVLKRVFEQVTTGDVCYLCWLGGL
jgi:hypothetical protein